jgi:hypothetical protein
MWKVQRGVRDGCLALLLLMCFQTCKSLFAGRTCLFYVMSQLWSAGTKNVIDACIQLKVKRLIYTSSPSVVFDGVHGIFNGDESLAYTAKVLNSLTLLLLESQVCCYCCLPPVIT